MNDDHSSVSNKKDHYTFFYEKLKEYTIGNSGPTVESTLEFCNIKDKETLDKMLKGEIPICKDLESLLKVFYTTEYLLHGRSI